MDIEAHAACMRALKIVSRSARLCAGLEPGSAPYQRSTEGAERSIDRAQNHYDSMRQGHAAHERAVRFVGTAVAEARGCVLVLTEALADPETLDRFASKIDRAIMRAEDAVRGKPAPASLPACAAISSGRPPPEDLG